MPNCALGHEMPDDRALCPTCGMGRLPASKAAPDQPTLVREEPTTPSPATALDVSHNELDERQAVEALPAEASPRPAPGAAGTEGLPGPRPLALPARPWRLGLAGRAILVLPVVLGVAAVGAWLAGGSDDGSTLQPGAEKVAASKQQQCAEAALMVVEGSYDSSGQTRFYRLSDNQEITREEFNALGNQYARFTTEVGSDARAKVNRGDALLHTLYDPTGRFSALPSPVTWIASKGLILSPATWPNEMDAYCADLDRMFAPAKVVPKETHAPDVNECVNRLLDAYDLWQGQDANAARARAAAGADAAVIDQSIRDATNDTLASPGKPYLPAGNDAINRHCKVPGF